MANRSRHLMSQISGVALAAFVVGSMSVHGHQTAANAQNFSRTGAPAVGHAAITSFERSNQSLRATNVDFDGIVPNIAHHY